MARPPSPAVPTLEARDAARVLLGAQGLLADPTRRTTPAVVHRVVERMGFVQLDSINVVARGHDLTLAARLDGYRPSHLRTLIDDRRRLFEHWTHDASAIPTTYFVPWRHRCRRMVRDPRVMNWLSYRTGDDPQRTIRAVLRRLRREGPLMSRDFERPAAAAGGSGAWWGWKPAKAALEFLWWRGDLSVAQRVNFQKVYDLTERHLPDLHGQKPPSEAEYVAWACRLAIDRLVVASAKEVAGFHGAVSLAEAKAFCEGHAVDGDLLRLTVGTADGRKPQPAFALADWRRRLRASETALGRLDDRLRLLSPFDPAIRDRQRLRRLFGFDYRFEAFVPAAKRRHGYYVLPVLRGDRFVARADVKLHRDRGELEVRGLWWEEGAGRTKRERRLFEEAVGRLASFAGAESVRLPRGA